MTTETAGCFRPTCRFAPDLKMTASGSLEISSWCSPACESWSVMTAAITRCESTPDVERQAQRLDLIAQLLDLRDNADEVVFTATATPVLTPPTEGTEAFDGRP